jgi:hypothetical protein
MQGLPLHGVCLYPIIDRPDWENPEHWHNSGLWDLNETAGGRLERVLNEDYADAFEWSRGLLAELGVR